MLHRTAWLASITALIIASALAFGGEKEDRFSIERYSFTWQVASSGEADLEIEKTQETLLVAISTRSDHLTFAPKNAERVGQTLKQTDQYFKKLKNAGGRASESAKAGEYTVDFTMDPKHGFYIVVRETGSYLAGRAMIQREQANAFAPHLVKAKAMADFVDKRIQP